MRLFVGTIAYIIAVMALPGYAIERPLPADFSDEIGQHWAKKEFDELRIRADQVYSTYPDFIPAIIAASFIDAIYHGRLEDSREKAQRVKDYIEEIAETVDERFVVGLDALIDMIDQESAFHEEAERSLEELEAGASPAAVREAFGPVLLPYLYALAFAPDEEIPVVE